jgi:hypothetical protein
MQLSPVVPVGYGDGLYAAPDPIGVDVLRGCSLSNLTVTLRFNMLTDCDLWARSGESLGALID